MSDALPSAPPRIESRASADFTAAGLLGAFLLLKLYALVPAPSDEYIYLYMGGRVAEGVLPYRDFFFAHPPFHLLPATLMMGLFGFSTLVAKAIPAAAAFAAGIAVYRMARPSGALPSCVSLVLFLFSFDLLRISSHGTGGPEAAALTAWALERAMRGRPGASGLLAASASLVAFYVIPAAVVGPGLVLFLNQRRSIARFAGSFAALFLGVNGLFAAVFGRAYLDPVFFYHFLKPGSGDQATSVLQGLASENNWIFWSAPAAGLAWILFCRPSAPAAAGLIQAAAHLAGIAFLGRIYVYYAVAAFPGLALAGGYAYAASLTGLRAAASEFSAFEWRRQAGRIAAALLVLSGPVWLRMALTEETIVLPTPTFRYVWREAPLPVSLNASIRAIFWNGDAHPSPWTPAITRYLQHESLGFDAPEILAARLRAITPEGSAIFGDSLSVPLVALMTGRPIAGDEADTNFLRFSSGITSPERIVARLEASPPAAVIASHLRGLFTLPAFEEWLRREYRIAETVNDRHHGRYSIFLRRQDRKETGER